MKPTVTIKDKEFELYIDATTIEAQIKSLAQKINKDYAGKKPLFVAVLNGSFMFVADLMKNITIDSEITFIKLSSYAGMQSSGKVSETIGLTHNIKDRHIIVIEDIVDTGNTLYQFMPGIQAQQPSSLALFVLLFKPTALKVPLQIDYTCFEIEDKFVIGYGMDYDELGRNLNAIYQLKNG